MSPRGKLFVFEGPDGVGKTTLAQALTAHLNATNQPCEYLAFPGREPGTLGQHVYDLHHTPVQFGIATIHPTSVQLLHVAAHIDAIEGRILPALQAGRWIILDRFWWSTWVYGIVAGIDPAVLRVLLQVEHVHWNTIRPAMTFLVRREAPLRDDEPHAHWHTLRTTYDELAREQQHAHAIQIIQNDHTMAGALAHIVATIATMEDMEQRPTSQPSLWEQHGHPARDAHTPHARIATERPTPVPRPFIYAPLEPAKPTKVLATYWRFAAERQAIFFKRVVDAPWPWTDDPILATYKFTNAYRASDRVSQYLIKHVIYAGDQTPEEVFFRTMLFKIFNSIDTWKLLLQALGAISYTDYTFEAYDAVLTTALARGTTIFSAAYIMPSGASQFGSERKHRNYLQLLEWMMRDEVPQRLTEMRSMRQAFELLRSYPLMGDFLAYQYVTDLNYSVLTNFSEMEFVMPGPGARDGIRKCFAHLGGLNEADIIRLVAEHQDEEFRRLELDFQSLWGRPLQLIDCQNLFCEVDKYARVAHPDVRGISGRQRIKQRYRTSSTRMTYWYPPKWGLQQVMDDSGGTS